jgi:hypothetical protein
MPGDVFTVIAALLGGAAGAIGGQVIGHLLERKRTAAVNRSQLVGGYLWQMQDASESLWRRLQNLAEQPGPTVIRDTYYEESTLYAIARFLAQKQRLGADGVYALVSGPRGPAGDRLRRSLESVERELGRDAGGGNAFYRYNRLALAETAMRHTEGGTALAGYQDFVAKVKEDVNAEFVAPAREFVRNLDEPTLRKLMEATEDAGRTLAATTGLRWLNQPG